MNYNYYDSNSSIKLINLPFFGSFPVSGGRKAIELEPAANAESIMPLSLIGTSIWPRASVDRKANSMRGI